MRILLLLIAFLCGGSSAFASEFGVALGRQCLVGQFEAYQVYMPDGYAVRFTCDPRVIIHLQGNLQWGADPSIHQVSQFYGYETRRGDVILNGAVGASVDYYNTIFLGQKRKEGWE